MQAFALIVVGCFERQVGVSRLYVAVTDTRCGGYRHTMKLLSLWLLEERPAFCRMWSALYVHLRSVHETYRDGSELEKHRLCKIPELS